jgi:predicted DNA-binding transcriptional regulator AlpA
VCIRRPSGYRKILRARDVQQALGIGRSQAYKILAECSPVRFGRSVRATEAAFLRWLKRHQVRSAWEVALQDDPNSKGIRLTRDRDRTPDPLRKPIRRTAPRT